jgi:hypothetical protein
MRFIEGAVGVAARAAVAPVLSRGAHRPPHAVEPVVTWSSSWALRSRSSVKAGVAARSIAAGRSWRALHPRMPVPSCGAQGEISEGDKKINWHAPSCPGSPRGPGTGLNFSKASSSLASFCFKWRSATCRLSNRSSMELITSPETSWYTDDCASTGEDSKNELYDVLLEESSATAAIKHAEAHAAKTTARVRARRCDDAASTTTV